jgi:nucleotide-binding universal stress UspA family protein
MNNLVIGAHSITGMKGLLLGDVAHAIISHADPPILVDKARAAESR